MESLLQLSLAWKLRDHFAKVNIFDISSAKIFMIYLSIRQHSIFVLSDESLAGNHLPQYRFSYLNRCFRTSLLNSVN